MHATAVTAGLQALIAPLGAHRRAARAALILVRPRSASASLGQDVAAEATEAAARPDVRPFSEMPGPRPLPLVGNCWRFVPGIGDFAGVSIHRLPFELHQRYGPIVKLEGLLTAPRVFLADPAGVQQVFRSEGPYPERTALFSMQYYFNNYRKMESLATSNGEAWKRFRTVVNQVAMQPRSVEAYVEPIDAVAVQFVDRMKSLRDGNLQMPDDFINELRKWASESITFVGLDTRLGLLEPDLEPDSDAGRLLTHVETITETMAHLEFGLSPWRHVPTPAWRRFKASLDVFTELAFRRVDAVVARLGGMSPAELTARPLSVLERLLVDHSNDPNKGVSFALDLMFAGIDSTAYQAASVLYFLASNPAQRRALQAELDREWPAGGPLDVAQLGRFKYLRAAVKEAMRLQSSTSGMIRNTPRDVDVMGYLLPKGTTVVVSTAVMCQDERLVPRAAEFLPERWLPGHEALRPRHAFVAIPFGFGPRMCAGKRFALLEIELLTARVLRSFDLEWHHPPPVVKQDLFVKFASPLKITVRGREPASTAAP